MKEKQAEHYQCEVDNLVEQQRSLEESHEKDLARMARKMTMTMMVRSRTISATT